MSERATSAWIMAAIESTFPGGSPSLAVARAATARVPASSRSVCARRIGSSVGRETPSRSEPSSGLAMRTFALAS